MSSRDVNNQNYIILIHQSKIVKASILAHKKMIFKHILQLLLYYSSEIELNSEKQTQS